MPERGAQNRRTLETETLEIQGREIAAQEIAALLRGHFSLPLPEAAALVAPPLSFSLRRFGHVISRRSDAHGRECRVRAYIMYSPFTE